MMKTSAVAIHNKKINVVFKKYWLVSLVFIHMNSLKDWYILS